MFVAGAGDLPKDWGFALGELPPMGASPDGIICHSIPITQAEINLAREQLTAEQHASQHGDKEAAALQLAARMLKEAVEKLTGVSSAAVSVGVTQDESSPQSQQEPEEITDEAVLLGSGHATNSSEPENTTTGDITCNCVSLQYRNQDSVRWLANLLLGLPLQSQSSPPTNSVPPSALASAGSSYDASSPLASIPPTMARMQWSPPQPTSRSVQFQQHTGPVLDDQGTAWVPYREVVEVKNHCPFRLG